MLSKAKIKFVKSLQIKKYRKQEQCFIVEGAKSVQELLSSDLDVLFLLATKDFRDNNNIPDHIEVLDATEAELKGIGEFQTNDSALAVARMRPLKEPGINVDEFALVLDDIRDPGNLGTIIRTADWYGISKIIASEETADFYNPKVIASSMGSFSRSMIFYTELSSYLDQMKGRRIFGAFLDGTDVHKVEFGNGGLILIGNESNGISIELERFVTDRITIPRYGKAESLNAAIAAGIICDNVRRS